MNKDKLIQGFLTKKLTIEELKEFEKLLKTDALIEEELNQYIDIQVAFQEEQRQFLKKSFEDLHLKEIRNTSRRKYFLISASILFVALVLISFFWNKDADPSSLYAENFEIYPNTLQPVVDGDVGPSYDPFIAYEAGNYDVAAKGFLNLLQNNENPDIRFYYAMSLLYLNENDHEVLLQLNNLKSNETKYLPQVYWYIGLINLKNENLEEVKINFKKLLEHPAKFKNREANNILDQLN